VIVVQAVQFGLHCSATEVTTSWLKQPFCFYSVGFYSELGMLWPKV